MILKVVKSGTFSFCSKSLGTFYRAIYSVRVCIPHYNTFYICDSRKSEV